MRRGAISKRLTLMVSTAALGALLALVNHIVTPSPVFAHGGGLDRYGCHRDNKAGNYHCHRAPCGSKTFASQAAMLKEGCATGK